MYLFYLSTYAIWSTRHWFYQTNEIIQLWANQWQSLLFRFRSTVLMDNTLPLNLRLCDHVNIFSIYQQFVTLQTGQKNIINMNVKERLCKKKKKKKCHSVGYVGKKCHRLCERYIIYSSSFPSTSCPHKPILNDKTAPWPCLCYSSMFSAFAIQTGSPTSYHWSIQAENTLHSEYHIFTKAIFSQLFCAGCVY